MAWFGTQPNADELAKRISPINYVNGKVPPIITIHGDKDELVPYAQPVRLHKALDAAKVPKLYTVLGGNHGGFSPEQTQKIWSTIRNFLQHNVKGLGTPTATK